MQPDHHHPDEADAADNGVVAATFCATLVDEWASLGVSDAVVCPGSRNTPVAVALASDARIRTQVVHDERSAAFLALGLGLSTGRPAVLSCTSGSAATHFHPAVVEADLAAVAMLVVTADRPPELQGVLAPQTIDQRDLYRGAVRWYCEPGPPAPGGSPWWRDLARDAVSRACGEDPGPVHLNLAFREPLTGTPGDLPEHDVRADPGPALSYATPWSITDEDVARLVPVISGRRGIIVAGARACRSEAERAAVLGFAENLGWPVLAEATSGLRVPAEPVMWGFDAMIRSGVFDAGTPEVVIRLGGLVASKATNQWLSAARVPQLAVDRYGRCPDPQGVVSRHFLAVPADVLTRLAAGAPAPAPPEWTDKWRAAQLLTGAVIARAVDTVSHGPVSEPAAARDTMAAVCSGGSLLVGSSMPVRDLEAFAPPRSDVTVHANRGANGIDGSVATATGIAIGSGTHTTVLCGDVAFLHDIGSLNGITRRGVDMTIVVVDNDGGGIFHFLAQAEELDRDVFERVFGTPHGHDLAGIAAAFGLGAEVVTSRVGLKAALAGSATRGGVRVVVVRSDRARNVVAHQRIQQMITEALESLETARSPRVGLE